MPKHLKVAQQLIALDPPLIMGILNVTPDSFYDGGRYQSLAALLEQSQKMLSEGADILDLGAYSSRPGAKNISVEEEIARLIPAIQAIKEQFPEVIISVDTFRAKVAEAALKAGAALINDISGGEQDPEMYALVAQESVPYILMHMRGNPQNMQSLSQYEFILKEIYQYFAKKVHQLRTMGVKDIVLDIGFGFAKTREQNFYLLKHLGVFKEFGLPILAGVSRKSMIYKTLGISSKDALNGTSVLNTLALMGGASILRVHDVGAAIEVRTLHQQYMLARAPNNEENT